MDLFDPDPIKFSPNFVGSKGSNTPHLFVVGEAPGYSEDQQGLPFVGKAGQLLNRAIEVSKLDASKIRFANVVPYRPIAKDGWKTVNRTPTPEEIEFYRIFVQKDIRKTQPQAILLVGKSAMTAFGITATPTDARTQKFAWEGIPVLTTWHPSYVARNGGERSRVFTELVSDLTRAWNRGHPEPASDQKFGVVDVLDWPQVREALEPETDIVLDYEASGLNQYEHTFRIGGIALRGLHSKKTFYVKIYDFWTHPDEFEVPPEIIEDIGDFLSRKHLIVFNLQYECGATLTVFKKYLRNVTDVLIFNRMLGGSGGLKEIAQRRLGVREWVSEVDEWNEIVEVFWKYCKPTHKGTVRSEIVFMQEGHKTTPTTKEIEEAVELFMDLDEAKALSPASYEKYMQVISSDGGKAIPAPQTLEDWIKFFPVTSKMNSEEIIEAIGQRQSRIYHALKKLIPLAHKYYSGDRYLEFCRRFFNLVWTRTEIKDQEIRYTDIPIEIIAPYAADDVSYTADLYLLLKKEIEEKGLVRTAEIFNCHAKLGFELESAGIAWDNVKAEELSNAYYKVAVERLRSLLSYEKFIGILEPSTQDILKIQTTQDLDDLTEFFNPRSTHKTIRDKFSRLLVTGRIRFQLMLYDIYKEWVHRPVKEAQEQWPVLWPIIEYLTSISSPSGEKTPDGADILKPSQYDVIDRYQFIDDMVEISEQLSIKIQSHPNNHPKKWLDRKGKCQTPPEVEVFRKFSNWDLDSMDAKIFEELYESFEKIGGIDIDNENTWIAEEFRYLLDFRMYKKVVKSYSTYIWGSLGRDAIALIDRDGLGEPHQSRIPGHKEYCPNDKVWILQTGFGVCTARTRRWQAGAHTVTAGSELLDLRTSRFPDGIRVHWDYCWAKDTKIKLLDGRIFTIEELSKMEARDLYTYSHALDNKESQLTHGSIVKAWPTKIAKTLLEVTLDNGFSLRMTHNHKLYKSNREIVEAKDLRIGDSLMSLYSSIDPWYCDGGYEICKITDERSVRASGGPNLTHKSIKERNGGWPDGYYVHHGDHNKLNNSPKNLHDITPADHMSIHMKQSWEDSYEERLRTNHLYLNKDSYEFRQKCSDDASKQWKNPDIRDKMISQARVGHARLRTEKSREAVALLMSDYTLTEIRELFKNGESWSRIITQKLGTDRLPKGMGVQTIKRTHGNIDKFLEENRDLLYNHKVASIREIDYGDWVYQLEIAEEYHNYFVIASDDNSEMILSKNSQNELVGLARVSQDKNLLRAFAEGQDIHRFVAANVWRKDPKDVTPTERRFAKSATFAIVYGDSPEGFSVKFMHGDRKGARDLFERVFNAFPTIKNWIAEQHRIAIDQGVVYSLLGNPMDVSMPREALSLSRGDKELLLDNVYTREIKFSDNREEDNLIRKQISGALRKAQNFPIQSLSSMLAGLGIYYMAEYCRDNNLSARIDCFTHDSGDIDTQICDIPKLFKVLPNNAVDRIREEFDIPVKTDFEIGLTGNSMIGLKGLKIDGDLMISGFEGHLDNLNDLIGRLELYGVKSSLKIEKETIEHKSLKDLFLPKKGYSMDIGETYKVAEGNLELDFSGVLRA